MNFRLFAFTFHSGSSVFIWKRCNKINVLYLLINSISLFICIGTHIHAYTQRTRALTEQIRNGSNTHIECLDGSFIQWMSPAIFGNQIGILTHKPTFYRKSLSHSRTNIVTGAKWMYFRPTFVAINLIDSCFHSYVRFHSEFVEKNCVIYILRTKIPQRWIKWNFRNFNAVEVQLLELNWVE